ncbi:MAG: carbon storage regulator [Proteobacteria bacterium]|nr:carbon storage regulator [Pseudomonadota bacterium]
MLTLTRKPEETIVIGDGPERIEVIVKEIRRNQVRIGILAPENVRIFRKELIEREEDEGEETSFSSSVRSGESS